MEDSCNRTDLEGSETSSANQYDLVTTCKWHGRQLTLEQIGITNSSADCRLTFPRGREDIPGKWYLYYMRDIHLRDTVAQKNNLTWDLFPEGFQKMAAGEHLTQVLLSVSSSGAMGLTIPSP